MTMITPRSLCVTSFLENESLYKMLLIFLENVTKISQYVKSKLILYMEMLFKNNMSIFCYLLFASSHVLVDVL